MAVSLHQSVWETCSERWRICHKLELCIHNQWRQEVLRQGDIFCCFGFVLWAHWLWNETSNMKFKYWPFIVIWGCLHWHLDELCRDWSPFYTSPPPPAVHLIWMWTPPNTVKAKSQHFNLLVIGSFEIQCAGEEPQQWKKGCYSNMLTLYAWLRRAEIAPYTLWAQVHALCLLLCGLCTRERLSFQRPVMTKGHRVSPVWTK